MTGIDYLLDTNFLIGLLKNEPDTLTLPDAIIAATALVYGAELLTHDKALRNLLENDSLR